jgi:predicted adenylyl cyclase CyaB
MKNIEIKYRLSRLQKMTEFLSSLPEVRQVKTIQQTDIYYSTLRGRLKLRIPSSGRAELIYYEREDLSSARESDYHLFPVKDPDLLDTLLSQALEVKVQVKKQRTLFMFRNVRIHLDQVEDLGEFLEFESVLDEDTSPELAAENLHQIQQSLAHFNLIPQSGSYADLLIEKRSL